MKSIFELSHDGRGINIIPESDVPIVSLSQENTRASEMSLPEVSENELSRHYTELQRRTYGVNSGFYPLGSCTMKYNPKIDEEIASLKEFTDIHPLQPESTVQGCLEVLHTAEKYLCEITGMDAVTFQPAAGAHGEFTGLMLIKAYHEKRGDLKRNKIIVPDSAHGTNPASASMAGFDIINIPSNDEGCVDIEKLKAAVGEDTAGLMLTNPNTVGIFDKNITEITEIVHQAGGLNYYDGANLNAVIGITRPGDMGFDVIHMNLHKTFATPHGGGGPGSGPVGCKMLLKDFLPSVTVVEQEDRFVSTRLASSIGDVKWGCGNFLVVVKALTYMKMLGKQGIPEVAIQAVLNANYMKKQLSDKYKMAFDGLCMHEFVMCLEDLKHDTGVSALDIAKGLIDYGIHPPTMYFPLIVHEALMIEPTETEPKEVLDECVDAFLKLFDTAYKEGELLHSAPMSTPIGRPDELSAARNPKLRF